MKHLKLILAVMAALFIGAAPSNSKAMDPSLLTLAEGVNYWAVPVSTGTVTVVTTAEYLSAYQAAQNAIKLAEAAMKKGGKEGLAEAAEWTRKAGVIIGRLDKFIGSVIMGVMAEQCAYREGMECPINGYDTDMWDAADEYGLGGYEPDEWSAYEYEYDTTQETGSNPPEDDPAADPEADPEPDPEPDPELDPEPEPDPVEGGLCCVPDLQPWFFGTVRYVGYEYGNRAWVADVEYDAGQVVWVSAYGQLPQSCASAEWLSPPQ